MFSKTVKTATFYQKPLKTLDLSQKVVKTPDFQICIFEGFVYQKTVKNIIIGVWKSGENARFDRIIYKQIYK